MSDSSYSAADLRYVVDVWEVCPSAHIVGRVVGRSPGAIRTLASRLGLRVPEDQRHVSRGPWTKAEDAAAVALAAMQRPLPAIASAVGRTLDATAERLSEILGETALEALALPELPKRAPEAVKSEPTSVRKAERKCLRCSKHFRSDGPGNRICRYCKSSDEWKAGAGYDCGGYGYD